MWSQENERFLDRRGCGDLRHTAVRDRQRAACPERRCWRLFREPAGTGRRGIVVDEARAIAKAQRDPAR